MIEKELPDGTILEFPDGTSGEVVERTTRSYLSRGVGLTEELKRHMGLAARPYARALMTAGGIGTALLDPLTGGGVSRGVDRNLQALGFPEPETGTERVAAGAAEAMAGVPGAAVASAVARPISRLGQAFRELLLREMGAQTRAAGAGAAAGGTALEMDASPEQQLTATVAGSVLGGGRTIPRAPHAEEFRAVGARASLGDVTGSRTLQTAEEIAANLPGGRRIMQGFREGQQGDIGKAARGADEAVWRLGKAPPKQQNAAGGVFSADTFLSNWSKLDAGQRQNFVAKLAVEKGEGNSLAAMSEYQRMRHDLDNIARAAETLRKKEQSMSFVRNYGRWTPGGLVLFAVMSSPLGAASAYGAAVGAGKALTYSPFVRWLSDASRMTEREVPAQIQQLRAVIAGARDPETKAAIEEYARVIERELAGKLSSEE